MSTTEMGFNEAITSSFAFLSNEGFALTEESYGRVRYESKSVYVTVWWDPSGYDLNLRIGLRFVDRVHASSEAAQLASGLVPTPTLIVTTRQEMQDAAAQLAEILTWVDPRFLAGDPTVYEEVLAEAKRRGTTR